jgi:hypothetical protein
MILILWMHVFPTALGDAASQMASHAWRPLQTQDLTHDMFFTGDGNVLEPIFCYSHNGVWDENTQQLLYMGSPHYQPWRFLIYSAETNSWRRHDFPFSDVHSYDKIAMDEKGNMYYYKTPELYKFNTLSDSWSQLPSLSADFSGGLVYFPERNGLYYVEGGSVYFFDLSASKWSTVKTGLAMGGLHNIAEYNPVHHFVLFGGGNGSRDLYRIDTDGSITKIKNTAFELRNSSTLFAPDPVTGNYVFITADKTDSVYEYNPINETWKSVAKNFISDVGNSVFIPISTYGVIAYLTDSQWPVLLFKNGEGTATRPFTGAGIERFQLKVAPNPFSIRTRITLPMHSALPPTVQLEIMNIQGRVIEQLRIDRDLLKTGYYWEAQQHTKGVYILRMTQKAQSFTKKIIIQK